jgi:hypothetical protein
MAGDLRGVATAALLAAALAATLASAQKHRDASASSPALSVKSPRGALTADRPPRSNREWPRT